MDAYALVFFCRTIDETGLNGQRSKTELKTDER